jgi:arginine N-succinyltransferase
MSPPPAHPFVRLANMDDIGAILALAALTDGGMTNLPDDAPAMERRLAWSERSVAASVERPADEMYLLVMEDGEGHVIGTANIFSRLGATWPFYSYKLARVTHVSRDLERMFSTQLLHLVNDFDGASEVGGLFLHPEARRDGMGNLLARSRYLFIAQHRARFGDTVVAELRGWVDGRGNSPFWDAVAGPFFGGRMQDADLYNAKHGNQFIADLMPRYPIYTSMLPQAARDAIGKPHDGSVPALQLLLHEGFVHDGYCDVFDGGPTVQVRTDAIATIRHCAVVGDMRLSTGPRPLAASGTGRDFRAWRAL